MKAVITTETIKIQIQYQALLWKETQKLLMSDKRSLNSILSVFSIEIFLNNVLTINTKRSGMTWELNLIAIHCCILFLSVLP